MLTPEKLAELEKLLPMARLILDYDDETWTAMGCPDENTRDLAAYEALQALPDLLEALRPPAAELDLDLLRKFASGEGGRRTGELIRAGYLRIVVTPEGMKALAKDKGE